MQSRRIKNFDTEFKDGQLISDAMTYFIGGTVSKFFQNLRTSCQGEDDFKNNADKLMPALSDFGLQSHIIGRDLFRP